ncbi:MAG: hypothetical protein WCC10_15730, partial [Tumebacillaceae bacterium]
VLADDNTVTDIIISGRPAGPFASKMGNHLTAWSAYTELVTNRTKGQDLPAAIRQVIALYDSTAQDPGAIRHQRLKQIANQKKPTAQVTRNIPAPVATALEDWNEKNSMTDSDVPVDTGSHYEAACKEAEEVKKNANNWLKQDTPPVVLMNILQKMISAFLHVRNTMPLSAVLGTDEGLRAVGRGEFTTMQKLRIAQQEAIANKLKKQGTMLVEDDKETEARRLENRTNLWALLDPGAVDFYSWDKDGYSGVPGMLPGESFRDVMYDTMSHHMHMMKETFPELYEESKMGVEDSQLSFIADMKRLNEIPDEVDQLIEKDKQLLGHGVQSVMKKNSGMTPKIRNQLIDEAQNLLQSVQNLLNEIIPRFPRHPVLKHLRRLGKDYEKYLSDPNKRKNKRQYTGSKGRKQVKV